MEIQELKQELLPTWAGAIPEELFVSLMQGKKNYHAAGARFLDETAGAICWEENEAGWSLRSIYVFPEYRRLGIASELIAQLSARMQKENSKLLTITYNDEEDLVMLEPFLTHCGFRMETITMPLGVTQLSTVQKRLEDPKLPKKVGSFARLHELNKRERLLCSKWMEKNLQESMEPYATAKPSSYILLNESQVDGILLFGQAEDSLTLDYIQFRSSAVARVLPLLSVAVRDLSESFPPDTRIEMLLSNERAVKLFSHLTGSDIESVTIHHGSFIPLPRLLIAE